MGHKVKCIYCEKIFDRDKEPCQKIGRRYAHLACYRTCHVPDDDFITKISELVKSQYQTYNFPAIERQRLSYLKKGFSNEGIYNALYYYYVIQKKSTLPAEGRIGIVPYIYDEAQEYFNQLKKNSQRIEKAAQPMKEISVSIPKEHFKEIDKKRIDLTLLE